MSLHQVVVLALPDVVAFDLSIPAQVFGHVDERDHYRFTVCAERPGRVPTTTGFDIHVDAGLAAIRNADTVIVPGFRPLEVTEQVRTALRAAAEGGTRMVSICTGAFALAAAGLLDGRRATTHWRDIAELRRRHPRVELDPDVLYIDGGNLLTSAGVAAGLDLCLHIVRSDRGAADATRIARRMVVAPHRSGGQAQYLERPVPGTGGPAISSVAEWALRHLDRPLTVGDLARRAGFAPRTLARRWLAETGSTPLRWLTEQRLLEVRRLLETTDLPVAAIAHRTGIGSAAHLRTLFTRETTTTPSAYRAAHQGAWRSGHTAGAWRSGHTAVPRRSAYPAKSVGPTSSTRPQSSAVAASMSWPDSAR
jgi:transcriptional regulator GlxA family with amidase domain